MTKSFESDPEIQGRIDGTGKTFLFTLLIDKIGSKETLCGCLVFRNMFDINDWGEHCTFSIQNSDQSCWWLILCIWCQVKPANYQRRAKAIFFDEAPMMHRFHIEAINRSVRDTCRHEDGTESNKAFAGKLCIFGGDFRQTAPGMCFKSF